jgi:hypothetical protein
MQLGKKFTAVLEELTVPNDDANWALSWKVAVDMPVLGQSTSFDCYAHR